jgi:peptidyl-prolyl cis-trans isomerase C
MLARPCLTVAVLAVVSFAGLAHGQADPMLPPPAAAKPKVAAVVNGKEITELAVQRALKPLAPENRDKARNEVIKFLTENALVDHYLELLKVTVEPAEVAAQHDAFKKDVVAAKQEYAKVLARMELTEAELLVEIRNQLRWEKFVAQQATEERLKKLFDSNPEIFDGSTVRARHILIAAEPNDDTGKAAALKKAQEIKTALDSSIAAAAAKAGADADNLTRERLHQKAADDAFAAAARAHSVCPSKRDGGNLGEFPRMGMMVEPFSKAAFALKPFQVSDPVQTPYGCHLILVTGRKPGEAVKFDAVKGAVTEVYASRLREAIVEKMKADPNTRIEIAK